MKRRGFFRKSAGGPSGAASTGLFQSEAASGRVVEDGDFHPFGFEITRFMKARRIPGGASAVDLARIAAALDSPERKPMLKPESIRRLCHPSAPPVARTEFVRNLSVKT